MKSIGCGIAALVIALAVINSASAERYVVYGGYWQDSADVIQAPSPEQAPSADMKEPMSADYGYGYGAGCGCGASYSNCCSGWWNNYCSGRQHLHRHHCHRRWGHACGGGYDSYGWGAMEGSCGCGESAEGTIEGKSPEQAPEEPPIPTPEVEAGDKSARVYGRIIRW